MILLAAEVAFTWGVQRASSLLTTAASAMRSFIMVTALLIPEEGGHPFRDEVGR